MTQQTAVEDPRSLKASIMSDKELDILEYLVAKKARAIVVGWIAGLTTIVGAGALVGWNGLASAQETIAKRATGIEQRASQIDEKFKEIDVQVGKEITRANQAFSHLAAQQNAVIQKQEQLLGAFSNQQNALMREYRDDERKSRDSLFSLQKDLTEAQNKSTAAVTAAEAASKRTQQQAQAVRETRAKIEADSGQFKRELDTARSELAQVKIVVRQSSELRSRIEGFRSQLQSRIDELGQRVKTLEEVKLKGFSPELEKLIQPQLSKYQDHFVELGYEAKEGRVAAMPHPTSRNNAFYNGAINRIEVGMDVADDIDFILEPYTLHILQVSNPDAWRHGGPDVVSGALVRGMAFYFVCSFSDDPLLGERAAKAFHQSRPDVYQRGFLYNLENTLAFNQNVPRPDPYVISEAWGGAFWELRRLLAREYTDRLLFTAWRSLKVPSMDMSFAKAYVSQVLSVDSGKNTEQIRSVFTRRGLKL